MIAELDVSQSTFQTLMVHGMPFTEFRGLLWFEPEKVHAWLDKFNRVGAPGIRRVKGVKLKAHVTLKKRGRNEYRNQNRDSDP